MASTIRPGLSAARVHALALALMLMSGFAALGYQIAWTQQSTLWLGHESAAVLAVVAAFFGGLALGAFLLSPRIEASLRPARWYAACEIVIALWAVALVFAHAPASDLLLDAIGAHPSVGRQWSIAFGGTLLLLLPATAAMGATLPAMECTLQSLRGRGSLPTLYAANTLGAVFGVLLAAFFLIPILGLRRTIVACAGVNLICALAALSLDAHARHENLPPAIAVEPTSSSAAWLLAATGLLGIGYEVMVVRALSQVAENTVYTFAVLLAVYLVGTAVGGALYARFFSGVHDRARLRDGLTRTLTLSCLLGIAALSITDELKSNLLRWGGPSVLAALSTEALLALITFLLPTIVMGALFSHLAMSAKGQRIGLGRALAANLAGAALAPLGFGGLLLSGLGVANALLMISGLYLLLVSPAAWRSPWHWSSVAAAAAVVIWSPAVLVVNVPDGGKIISYREGMMATVSVVEDAAGVATLHINNRQQEGSSATQYADARQALLPILLHEAPQRSLFLGLGTGITAWSAAIDPNLQIDAVELVPEVIAASRHFTPALADTIDLRSAASRLQVMQADARRFVRTVETHYDVIVADNFHPARSGSGALYTVEHFEAIAGRLTKDGLFCQWLPLHQLDLDTLRSIVRGFLQVYPNGRALLATNSLETPVIGLLGQRQATHFDIASIRRRLNTLETARFGLEDEWAVLGTFIASPKELTRFADDATINSDDRPIVVYAAPRITYEPSSEPRDRLLALLAAVDIQAADLMTADAATNARLAAYWKARERFIGAGRGVRPSSDVGEMLRQVRAPLIEVLRISPDFRPAYDPLLRMAKALERFDADAARILLSELHMVSPGRPEAAAALDALR